MAARNKLTHDYKTRQKIQTTQLVKRLEKHIFSDDGEVMTASQVRAAEILLKKTLPDTQSIAHTGEDGGPMVFERVKRSIVDNTNS
jgi:hypothetical protein